MDDKGILIAKLRKRQKLSQGELAMRAGVSQATISRLEKQEQEANVTTLAKLARALGVELSQLVPEATLNAEQDGVDSFFAFCENPFCHRNDRKLNEEQKPVVFWNSWQALDNASWSDVNFCRACGGDLVKECTSCNRRITEKNTRFCTRCGKKLSSRPTKAEWLRLEEQVKAAAAKPKEEDDIPF